MERTCPRVHYIVGSSGRTLVGICHIVGRSPRRLVGILTQVRSRCVTLRRRAQEEICFVRGHACCGRKGPGGVAHTTLFVFFVHAYCGNVCSIGRDKGLSIAFNTKKQMGLLRRRLVHFGRGLLRSIIVLSNSCQRATRCAKTGSLFCFSPPCGPIGRNGSYASCVPRSFKSRRRVGLTGFYGKVNRANTG